MRTSTLLFFFLCSLLSKDLRADLLDESNQHYMQRDFEDARKGYEELLSKNPTSANLLYNIGNCYYKTGQLGKAVLYYERAARLSPDDEDIEFNLRLASLKTIDRIETVPPIIYKRWFNSVAGALTVSQWSILLIVLVWLAFAAWAYYLFSGTRGGKKTGFILASMVSGLCIIVFLLLNDSYRESSVRQFAVVLSASSYVKSAPDDRGDDQFILHEGTRLEVLDELGEWKKIRIANGSVGWLRGKDIEVI